MTPEEYNKQLDWADNEVGKLRAILAPLLEAPGELAGYDISGIGWYECRFCGADVDNPTFGRTIETTHKPDCPVLRKDELLHARYPDAIRSGR
jgi:hypothetical protein